jgi:hypothetical protein
MRRAFIVGFAMCVMAGTLAGQTRPFEPLACDDVRNDRDRGATECDIRQETVTGSVLDVDAGGNGSIRVRGWDRADSQLRVMITARARTAAAARDIVSDVRVTTSSGRVRVDGPDRLGSGEWWSASFELQVPQNSDLTLNTRNGSMAIHDFRGSADFRAVNGSVTLNAVNGDIRGETTNGSLNVSLSGNRWEGAGLDLRTVNGAVRLYVPESYSAVLETGTVHGGLDFDVPVTVQGRLPSRRNNRLTATLGQGGSTIRVTTTNGGVSLLRASR